MKKKINIKEKLRKFREWQQQPCQLPPKSEEEHNCACCQTTYQGNYCPKCGQSAHIKRYSFKNTLLNFMDVWGIGSDGKLRTIRDLILRPGYMIRDYLNGIQAAYFQPFKMFFVLAALSILVTHGVNIKGKNFADDNKTNQTEIAQQNIDNNVDESTAQTTNELTKPTTDKTNNSKQIEIDFSPDSESNFSDHQKQFVHDFTNKTFDKIFKFEERFPNILALLMLMYISVCLYLFFRHCPKIPDLRYSELFIALVFMTNMYSLYSIVLNFFCLTKLASSSIFLIIIPFKQLSGYSWKRTISYLIISLIVMIGLLILLVILYALALTGYAQIAVK